VAHDLIAMTPFERNSVHDDATTWRRRTTDDGAMWKRRQTWWHDDATMAQRTIRGGNYFETSQQCGA
jgi:hypothetical protein